MFTWSPQLPAADIEQRRLAVFLVASLMLHAATIMMLPDIPGAIPASRPGMLEVAILAPRTLPVATEPEPPLAKPGPLSAKEATKQARAAPVLALPRPEPLESSFAVAPPLSQPAEAVPATPDPRSQSANAVAALPRFDAAYLANPAPAYPPAAQRAGEEGMVRLRVLVKRDGLPSRVEIEKSSGSRQLDVAARDAVRGWRFVPARQGADPIESWMRVPVVFRLEGPG